VVMTLAYLTRLKELAYGGFPKGIRATMSIYHWVDSNKIDTAWLKIMDN